MLYWSCVRLPIERIYTTNFDNLLEIACNNASLTSKTIWKSSHLDSRTERLIYKLHGDLDDPEEIVITAEQFEEYLNSHDALAKIVEREMLERTILFVGYGFSDPDIRTILRTKGMPLAISPAIISSFNTSQDERFRRS